MQKTQRTSSENISEPIATAPSIPGMPSFTEFVVIVSALMGLTALSIDIMLPALGQISADYGLDNGNDQQLVITIYLLGFAFGQLFFGPLSDRFGRKIILLCGLGLYALASLLCMFAWDFEVLLVARLLQGLANGSPRILALATVRDIYAGRRMAEVMSFSMMVFIIIPILAPSIGAGILMLGEWHSIFGFLAVISMLLFAWTAWRLPETHPAEQREAMSVQWLLDAGKTLLTTRQTFGYTLSMGIMLSSLFTYITLSEQIFSDIYVAGKWFPILFGMVALALIVSSFTNSRLVMRLGMRTISHWASVGFIAIALLHLGWQELVGPPGLVLFIALLAFNLFFHGLTMPNFNALAMEPMGRIAGTASSFIGAVTTAISATLSGFVAHFYTGSAMPLLIGFVLCGLLAFVVVLITEKGRLFAES